MKVIKCDTYEEMSEVSANIIVEELEKKPNLVLGCATGSTPIGTYKNLIKAYENGIVSFKDVTTYNLDEYVGLEPSHEQAYRYFMEQNLFNHIDLEVENINFPLGNGDLDACTKKYQDELGQKQIDVQILGIGSNGHIAFNEPNTSFDSHVHIVKLDEQTREDNKRFFNSIDEVPTSAITMGIKDIMSAKKIILLANGDNKTFAVNELLNGLKTEEFPASILMDHPDVTLITDGKAGKDIE